MAIVNVLPFESPVAAEPHEIVEIAKVLAEGARVTITAPPVIATLITRMAAGWNRDPNSHMAVEAGEPTPQVDERIARYFRGGERIARHFTFRLRPGHWMATIAEDRGWGIEPEPEPAAVPEAEGPDTMRGIEVDWQRIRGAWEVTYLNEYTPPGATEPTNRVELQVRVVPGALPSACIECHFKVISGTLPDHSTYISLDSSVTDMRMALAYVEGICDTLLGSWYDAQATP